MADAASSVVDAASMPMQAASAAIEDAARGSITFAALVGVILVVVFAGLLLLRLPKADDIETQKVRFAAATFTGLLLIFVFTAVLYFSDVRPTATNAGKDIFEKAMTAMTPLIGVIVGYLFGTREKAGGGGAANPGATKKSAPGLDTKADEAAAK